MTSSKIIEPGSTLGMLGGGQLGGFFTESALKMGYKVVVWDPSTVAPAKRFATLSFDASFDDVDARRNFIKAVDASSLEWENVPVSLVEELESEIDVRPGSRSLGLAQNRVQEKSFLSKHNFDLADYRVIYSRSELNSVDLPPPWIVKTATLGYDGHGQWLVPNCDYIKYAKESMTGSGPWVVERVVQFEQELSVVVGLHQNGHTTTYPPTENIHENNILKLSISPGRIPTEVLKKAQELATEVVLCIGEAGVFCVELFSLKNGGILVNEIAPRPHNSGHHTIDTFTISQYELQIRALCGLPMPTPIMKGHSVLLNVLGEEMRELTSKPKWESIIANQHARIYLYGKESIRPGRKMGHILFHGDELATLIPEALETQQMLTAP